MNKNNQNKENKEIQDSKSSKLLLKHPDILTTKKISQYKQKRIDQQKNGMYKNWLYPNKSEMEYILTFEEKANHMTEEAQKLIIVRKINNCMMNYLHFLCEGYKIEIKYSSSPKYFTYIMKIAKNSQTVFEVDNSLIQNDKSSRMTKLRTWRKMQCLKLADLVAKESGIRITFGDKTNELELAKIVDKKGNQISVTQFCKEYENDMDLKKKYKKDTIAEINIHEVQTIRLTNVDENQPKLMEMENTTLENNNNNLNINDSSLQNNLNDIETIDNNTYNQNNSFQESVLYQHQKIIYQHIKQNIEELKQIEMKNNPEQIQIKPKMNQEKRKYKSNQLLNILITFNNSLILILNKLHYVFEFNRIHSLRSTQFLCINSIRKQNENMFVYHHSIQRSHNLDSKTFFCPQEIKQKEKQNFDLQYNQIEEMMKLIENETEICFLFTIDHLKQFNKTYDETSSIPQFYIKIKDEIITFEQFVCRFDGKIISNNVFNYFKMSKENLNFEYENVYDNYNVEIPVKHQQIWNTNDERIFDEWNRILIYMIFTLGYQITFSETSKKYYELLKYIRCEEKRQRETRKELDKKKSFPNLFTSQQTEYALKKKWNWNEFPTKEFLLIDSIQRNGKSLKFPQTVGGQFQYLVETINTKSKFLVILSKSSTVSSQFRNPPYLYPKEDRDDQSKFMILSDQFIEIFHVNKVLCKLIRNPQLPVEIIYQLDMNNQTEKEQEKEERNGMKKLNQLNQINDQYKINQIHSLSYQNSSPMKIEKIFDIVSERIFFHDIPQYPILSKTNPERRYRDLNYNLNSLNDIDHMNANQLFENFNNNPMFDYFMKINEIENKLQLENENEMKQIEEINDMECIEENEMKEHQQEIEQDYESQETEECDMESMFNQQ